MTPIEIVNIGVMKLGERPINSFDESSSAAICARSLFRQAVRAVLEEHPWNDATGRALLPAELTPPPFDFSFSYILPPDCLRVREIRDSDALWERSGRRLLTNEPAPIKVLYTRDLSLSPAGNEVADGEDIAISGLLASAVGLRWASWAAKRITGSETALQILAQDYERALVAAIAVNAAEGTVEPDSVGSWVNASASDPWVTG